MIDYLNSVKSILDNIRSAKEQVSPEALLRIVRLEEDIKKLSGLTGEVNEVNDLDQDELESEFNTWVSTPQVVSTSNNFKVTRKTLEGYDELRARSEWGKTKRIVYNNTTKL